MYAKGDLRIDGRVETAHVTCLAAGWKQFKS